ncbi:hypothetical protein BVRB_041020 [Beta vulgaris subsp. vulgaris]|uniref:Uncharacterized protein n=1 Tax=Beta vulgaris subsp. vulgaris TaxID=3555 RepID=A0A0J8BGQ2_BETVV|nr:hypothetical protein BVRB_041020 [Beta vulgaris subsp. vulgaris]
MSHEDVALLACLRLGGMTPSHLFVDFVFRAAQMTTSSNLAVLCFCASRLCYASRRIAEANARSSGDRINQIITDGLTKSQSTVLAVCSVIGSKFDMDLLLVVLHALSQKGEVFAVTEIVKLIAD